jgi:hypothetical protein
MMSPFGSQTAAIPLCPRVKERAAQARRATTSPGSAALTKDLLKVLKLVVSQVSAVQFSRPV